MNHDSPNKFTLVRCPSRCCYILASLALLAVLQTRSKASERDELYRLMHANDSAIEAIQSIRCRVVIEDPNQRFGIPGGEYWRSGNTFRVHWRHRVTENQAVVRDGVARYLVRQDLSDSPTMRGLDTVRPSLENNRFFWHASVETHKGGSLTRFDPWFMANCALSDGGLTGNLSLSEFCNAHLKELSSIKHIVDAGRRLHVIEFRLPSGTCRISLDPGAMYMIRRTELNSDSPKGSGSSSTVTAFASYGGGVFFPSEVVVKRWGLAKEEADERIVFHHVVVNQPISAATFDLHYRHGTFLKDRIEGVQYHVDSSVPLT